MGKVSLAPKVEAELSRLRIDKAEFLKDYLSIKNAVDANPALVEGWKKLFDLGENSATRQRFITEFDTYFKNVDEAVTFVNGKGNLRVPQNAAEWNILRQEFDVWTTAKKIDVNTNDMKLVTGRSKVYVDKKANESTLYPHELDFAENKVSPLVKDKIILPTDPTYPAIDGIYKTTGQAFSFKSMDNSLKKFIKTINKAYTELATNNSKAVAGTIYKGKPLKSWTNVDLHVELKFDVVTLKNGRVVTVNEQSVLNAWRKGKNDLALKNDGIITKVTVHLKNGKTVDLDLTSLR